ncbi:MAG TPA: hypothetical protein VJX70_10405 [Candidatus Acidoferrum sp.]|nr:hypothetical protein [Candidatus Acidoferrum sp.]
MRLSSKLFPAFLAAAVLLAPLAVRAQNPDMIAPDVSEAKAKQILNQLVQGMGGPAYLGMNRKQCDGRRAAIGHNGALAGYVQFKDSWQFPDKNRTDYIARGRNTLLGYMIGVQELDLSHGGLVITLFSGDHGWTMDRSGVSDIAEDTVAEFQEAVQRNSDNLLRLGLKDPDLGFRWAGLDTVDLREVDWVEITDREQRTYRLAVDRSTHLLIRSVVRVKDDNTGQQREDVSIFTNYQPKGGVQVPMQITRERDGRRIAQFFYDNCQINPPLSADFFTRDALVQRFKETGGKKGK